MIYTSNGRLWKKKILPLKTCSSSVCKWECWPQAHLRRRLFWRSQYIILKDNIWSVNSPANERRLDFFAKGFYLWRFFFLFKAPHWVITSPSSAKITLHFTHIRLAYVSLIWAGAATVFAPRPLWPHLADSELKKRSFLFLTRRSACWGKTNVTSTRYLCHQLSFSFNSEHPTLVRYRIASGHTG